MRAFVVSLFIAAPVSVFAAPADPSDLSLVPMTLKMLAALGVVVGLFLLLYALVRKSRTWLPGGSAHDSIDVRAVRHLGPKRALYLVDVDGQRFFISAAGEQIRLLSKWDAAQGESDGTHEGANAGFETDREDRPSFAAFLQRHSRERKSSAVEKELNSSQSKELTSEDREVKS